MLDRCQVLILLAVEKDLFPGLTWINLQTVMAWWKRSSSCGWSILTAVKMSWKTLQINFFHENSRHTYRILSIKSLPGMLIFSAPFEGGGGGGGLLEGELI